MDCAELPQTVSPPKKRYTPNGKNLGKRKLIVEACLASGLSGEKTARIAGVSKNTVFGIKQHRDFTSPEQVARVREQLRDKATLTLDSALDISDADLKASKLSERSSLIRALAPLAGLSTPNHIETQVNVLNQYAIQAGPKVIENTPSETVATT